MTRICGQVPVRPRFMGGLALILVTFAGCSLGTEAASSSSRRRTSVPLSFTEVAGWKGFGTYGTVPVADVNY